MKNFSSKCSLGPPGNAGAELIKQRRREMRRRIRINLAWTVWNLLTDLNDKIRRRYEKDFLEAALKNDKDLLFFKKRLQHLIPF